MDEPRSARALGFERLLFFSDAVFAIAITLLVLDLRIPVGAPFSLAPVGSRLAGFAISFFVIGRYWRAHHTLFEAVRNYDQPLLGANLLFLAGVAFLPFPTSVIAQFTPATGPVMFYAVSLLFVGVAMLILVAVARRPAMLRPGETAGGTAHRLAGGLGSPLVFAITALVAEFQPHVALWCLLLLWPVGWATDRVGAVLERRIDGGGASQAA